jgi:hypothetical protein
MMASPGESMRVVAVQALLGVAAGCRRTSWRPQADRDNYRSIAEQNDNPAQQRKGVEPPPMSL